LAKKEVIEDKSCTIAGFCYISYIIGKNDALLHHYWSSSAKWSGEWTIGLANG